MLKNANFAVLKHALESKLTLNDQRKSSSNCGRGRGRGRGTYQRHGQSQQKYQSFRGRGRGGNEEEEYPHMDVKTPRMSKATIARSLDIMPRIVGTKMMNKLMLQKQ
jgi:hypothetical protein